MFKLIDSSRKLFYVRNIHFSSVLQKEPSKKRKVKETVELVTLVDTSGNILGLKTKLESENLAKKLNLSLIHVTDSKYGNKHPAYKLMSNSEVLKTVEKKGTSAKPLKRLVLNCRISDHDLTIKMVTIRKWIAKKCQIIIAISGNASFESSKNAVFEKLKEQLGNEGRILDVRKKDDALKFTVIPPKEIPQQLTSAKKDTHEEVSSTVKQSVGPCSEEDNEASNTTEKALEHDSETNKSKNSKQE